jgi:hypothetical protein
MMVSGTACDDDDDVVAAVAVVAVVVAVCFLYSRRIVST